MSEIHVQVTDPVCGMTIHRQGAIPIVHDGNTFYFCEAVCADTFRDDPERWADGFERRAHVIDTGSESYRLRASTALPGD